MLALTPVPLKTAGERALFGELTRWDTGGSVRAAVMASLPLADGSTQRRTSDAVLFVPEGLAVVRIAEVVRQSGVVTASPEGAWTIAPESGPSQALQLSGGGSSPLDGLMRAGMDTAMKLRRAGLEPGRIARLTVLVGDITGLLPADGDLGEGDQVATLDPRSLLLGIARASRYAGVDNPRLWTTADVRAALEALGLEGRGPSVEELNGEGFPYSPYVLRRAELLTPAAMAAEKRKKKVERFIESVYRAYRLVAQGQVGKTVLLVDILAAFTLRPGSGLDYDVNDFTRDIYALDRSGVRETKSGARISLPAATGTKGQRGVLTFVGPDGELVTYYGIRFGESS